uniref:G_PROTEIN_RECEP_F1_2 domain-containing protein n=1 Tax=Haemonchus contortus TaxID=6289 RepID=A0A7I5EBG2_HAECO
NSFINNHYVFYTSADVAFGLSISLSMEAWILVSCTSELFVLCVITAPFYGMIFTAFVNLMTTISILIPACYVLLIFLLRKNRIHQDSSRQIHRSLVIISLTTVFGWSSPAVFHAFDIILEMGVGELNVALLAGIFVNIASAANFFVYYSISTVHRREFDKYLLFGYLKRAMNFKHNSSSWATSRH